VYWYAIFCINSNLGFICHSFQDTATYSLKLFIENCGQTAADRDIVTIDSLGRQRSIWRYCRQFSTTYCLATIPHNQRNIVRYDFLRSCKVNNFHVIWKPICNFLLVINSNRLYLAPFSQHSCNASKRICNTTNINIIQYYYGINNVVWLLLYTTGWAKKTCHFNFVHMPIFANYWPIFKIFSLAHWANNLR